MCEALAAALNVEPSFFTKPVEAELDTDDCNFRSIMSRRTRDVEQVLAHGALLVDLVRFVEAELDEGLSIVRNEMARAPEETREFLRRLAHA